MMCIIQWVRTTTKETNFTPCCYISYMNRGKAVAIRERILSNARHAFADCDGGKAGAIIERTISNARHAVGDGDGGKAGAIIERTISNARHAVCYSIVGKTFRNSNIACVFSITRCYFCLFCFCNKIIIHAVNLSIIRTCHQC